MADSEYATLLREILAGGERVKTRNETVRRVFGRQFTFTKTPLVSARKTAWKTALREWEWFMAGSSSINDAHPTVRSWWGPWAEEGGEVWGNYGKQLRRFAGGDGEVDQIAKFVAGVRDHPFSRRNVLTTWHAADMWDRRCPITNCHGTVVQAVVGAEEGDLLSLHLVTYQRSADVVCGLPHNWIQYWAFLLWLAEATGTRPGSLTWVGGDIHVYEEHLPLAEETVDASERVLSSPELVYTAAGGKFAADDFILDDGYTPILDKRARMVV